MLEEYIGGLNIVKEKMKGYKIGKIIESISGYPEAASSILNALIVKTCINYILIMYNDYDGFNIGLDITDPKFTLVSDLEQKRKSSKLISQFSGIVLSWMEGENNEY